MINLNSSRRLQLFPAFFLSLTLVFVCELIAEEPEESIKKIKERVSLIKVASEKFRIDYEVLSAIIYVERTLNYDWRDEALDILIAQAGINSSIGFCQVKLKTAYWIEKQLADSLSIYFPGREYENILQVSASPQALISKLSNDSLNILYAAAYIRIIQSRWESEGFSINNRPEIIGTLYTTGLFYRDGYERKPRENPAANEFGIKVKENLNLFTNL
jgi:hypothetical protein